MIAFSSKVTCLVGDVQVAKMSLRKCHQHTFASVVRTKKIFWGIMVGFMLYCGSCKYLPFAMANMLIHISVLSLNVFAIGII